MEPTAGLEMMVNLFERRNCIIHKICVDDDATSTKAILRWSNEEDYMINNGLTQPLTVKDAKGKQQKRPNFGKLPGHITEPLENIFVVDLNHRRKVFTKELHRINALPAAEKHTTFDKNGCESIGEELWLHGSDSAESKRRRV
jgi:hypothetical protein